MSVLSTLHTYAQFGQRKYQAVDVAETDSTQYAFVQRHFGQASTFGVRRGITMVGPTSRQFLWDCLDGTLIH